MKYVVTPKEAVAFCSVTGLQRVLYLNYVSIIGLS